VKAASEVLQEASLHKTNELNVEQGHTHDGFTRSSIGNCQGKETSMVWIHNTVCWVPEDSPAGHAGGQMLPWVQRKSWMDIVMKWTALSVPKLLNAATDTE